MQRASPFCYILPYRSQNFISGGKKKNCISFYIIGQYTQRIQICNQILSVTVLECLAQVQPLEPISKYIILCGMDKLDKVQLLINSEETSFCTYIFLNKYQL